MTLYLAPTSSLELTRYLRSVNGEAGLEAAVSRKRLMDDAINSVRGIQELDTTAQLWLEHVERPIHAFVPNRESGTSTKNLVTHVFGQDIPFGCFLNLGHDVRMCSPQFLFMQLSTQYSTVDLVRIGMELCGTYSRWHMPPDRMDAAYRNDQEDTRSCTFGVPPATQTRHLRLFAERMYGQRGVAGARTALQWALDRSASPMETAVYLMLCLPKRLGGYGLPKPQLNPKILVSNPTGTVERYPDLFWLGPNIDVEYNSDAEHSGEWSRYRDSKREVELTVADVRVLPLTRPQVMDADAFDAFAQGLRLMLGIRARKPDAQWKQRRDELQRNLLLGK